MEHSDEKITVRAVLLELCTLLLICAVIGAGAISVAVVMDPLINPADSSTRNQP